MEVKEIDWEYYNTHNHHWEVDKLLEAQAEISFKAGWDERDKYLDLEDLVRLNKARETGYAQALKDHNLKI